MKMNRKMIMGICIFALNGIAGLTCANNLPITTASPVAANTELTLQIIEPVIVLNKQMIKSAKLAAFDNKNARIDLTLSDKASKVLYSRGKLHKNQKMIFTINNEMCDALVMQKNPNDSSFLISISTSRKNADLIMKVFTSY